jgi:RNA polymerase sigma-70 factor (ECF subfamily)
MDLVQDALYKAVKDFSRFTYCTEGDFLRWLARITENRIRDQVDRMYAAKRDIRKQVSLEDKNRNQTGRHDAIPQAVITTTPSAILSQKEELDRLERAMDKLKPEYKEVILLAKIDHLPHQDIADRFNRSPAAVAMLLSRALVALADAFEGMR